MLLLTIDNVVLVTSPSPTSPPAVAAAILPTQRLHPAATARPQRNPCKVALDGTRRYGTTRPAESQLF
jgi:hypothetical protein